ncbi:MAG: MFS transporter [Bacteroidales bacterium]|nr:MFS transporter [Bacteroidales bacterium]
MKEKLFTRNYNLVIAANFLLYFGFYTIMPILPFFMADEYGSDNATIGAVLSSFTVAALCIRPFSGYLLDTFARKPLYIFAYASFVALFAGYIVAGVLTFFVVLRIVQGLAFGMVTVAGNTVVIDVMPSSRRGEGVGYYGMANNIAMSTGPMFGLFLHQYCSYTVIFAVAITTGLAGLCTASLIRTRQKAPVVLQPISLDRFILLKGLPGGMSLLLLSIPYGITTTYIAMYGQQLEIGNSGTFFTLLAFGIASSRIFAGRIVDKGYLTSVIAFSTAMAVLIIAALGACQYVHESGLMSTSVLFHACALLMGITYGTLFPAYNTFFVDLAPHNQRGTAVSTYLTSWDVGIGFGLLLGGYVSEHSGFDTAYYISALLIVVSFVWFKLYVEKYYKREKIKDGE